VAYSGAHGGSCSLAGGRGLDRGGATGQGGLAASVPEERLARVQAECAASIVPGDRSEALQAALEQGGLASLYLMLRGAAEGAVVGAVTGGGAGDGAWIGAAVGAGVGVIVGLAVGIGKSVEEQRRYRAAVEGCVGERLTLVPETMPPDPPRTE